MNKLITLSVGLVLSFVSLTTRAQTMETKFGLILGGNMMMAGDLSISGATYTSKYVSGFQTGFFLDLPLSEKISFMPEVLYIQKGGKFEATIAGTMGQISTRAGYIDVPVMLCFNATPQFNISIGPQASFILHQRTKTYVNGIQTDSNTDTNDFRSAISGGIIGLGYKVTTSINLKARYSMDFQSAANDNVNQDKSRFSGFALYLGFGF